MNLKARLVALVFAQYLWMGYLPAAVAAPNAPLGPATQPAIDALKGLLTKSHLLLSSGPDSVSNRFCLSCVLDVPALNGSNYDETTHVLLARDKNRVGMVELTKEGLCYGYMIAGEMLLVDHNHPGQLYRAKVGFPELIFKPIKDDVHNEGEVNWEWGFERDADKPDIMLDFGSICDSLLSKHKGCIYDSNENAYVVQGSVAVWHFCFFSKDNASFPLKSVLIQAKEMTFSLSVLDGPEAAHQIEALPRDADTVNGRLSKLGLTVHDQEHIDWGALPPDFGKDPREIAAAEQLTKLETISKPPTDAGDGTTVVRRPVE